jgi:hypothetical protein
LSVASDSSGRERLPNRWYPLIEKESLRFKVFEHELIQKVADILDMIATKQRDKDHEQRKGLFL